MNLSNFKVASKLIWAFLMVTTVGAGIGVLGLMNLHTMSRAAQQMYEQDLLAKGGLAKVDDQMTALQRSLAAAERMSDCDRSEALVAVGQDETAAVLRAQEAMRQKLLSIVAQVPDKADNAKQANQLALGASTVAQQGRAVVASEDRSLAQRSAEASKEIKTLLTASLERVKHGTALLDKAGVMVAVFKV